MKLPSSGRVRCFVIAALLMTALLVCGVAWPQLAKQVETATSSAQPAVPEDALGRTTPRGTVLGFLAAANKGNYEGAADYLNTHQRGKSAAELARELAFVLDRRLPAHLNELSNDPLGSQSASVVPGQEMVGAIPSLNGRIEILLERVDRGKSGQVWQFSSQTLAAIPDLYDEINAIAVETVLPEPLLEKFLGITVYAWLIFCLGLPALYLFLSLLNRLLGALVGWVLRRFLKRRTAKNPAVLPHPLRLLIVAVMLRWSLLKVSLPLLSRQFWISTSIIIAIIALVWLFVIGSARCEAPVKRRLARWNAAAAASLVRPARRVIDVLAAFVGLLITLHAVGVNPTAALAGLGVGGIAIALAAQKTLENVIGGASIIMDGAIRLGDYLKIGSIEGTVEEIGLRSTRVRTLDRTVVSVPNGQMASMTLENFTFRDWFWFHHMIGLRYETTLPELSFVLSDIRDLLTCDSRVVGRDWLRVRLLGFKQSGFDIEVFAYLSAQNWPHFLEIQEELLLRIMALAQARGARIAPSQTVELAQSAEQHSVNWLSKSAPTGA